MHSRAKAPTQAEKRRFDLMKDIGCIACYLGHARWMPADIHHMLSGGKRIGHSHTIPLCLLHHRGFDAARDGIHRMDEPSLADSKREFVAKYGSEEYLLEKTNEILAAVEGTIVNGTNRLVEYAKRGSRCP